MICPNCREDNAPTFRFCGMCGTPLEPRRPTGAPALDPLSAFPATPPQRSANAQPPLRPVTTPAVAGNEMRPVNKTVPPISGPSMLGLNQAVANQSATGRTQPSEFDLNQPGAQHPSADSLREGSFSGFGSFMEPEEPKTGGRRIVLLLALLAALGGAAWWTYTNYLSPDEKRPALSSSTGEGPSDNASTSAKPSNQDSPAKPEVGSAPAATAPATAVPEGPSENAGSSSDASAKPPEVAVRPAETKPSTRAAAKPEKTPPAPKHETKHELPATSAKASKLLPQVVASDKGDADFRKGEAFLYGRGVPENCDQAVRNLKAASARSNAKARSAFGTMYATGHCVPRDLPTSYSWFALALRVDPSNQILEKDLNAVWNQMTPPERQMATRAKQQ